MTTFIYIIWWLLVVFFLVMWLWTKLENIANKRNRDDAGDFFRQGMFVLGCVLFCTLVDRYLLESFYQSLSPASIPIYFYQIILLPLVLFIAAKLVGGSKDILIKNKRKIK